MNHHLKIKSPNSKTKLLFGEEYEGKITPEELTIFKEGKELITFPFNTKNPEGVYNISSKENLVLQTLTEEERKSIEDLCENDQIEIDLLPEKKENFFCVGIKKNKKEFRKHSYTSEEEAQAFINLAIETFEEKDEQ